MQLDDYQKKAITFAKYKTPDYPFLALPEEAGEVSGKLAKAVRKKGITAANAINNACYGHDQSLLDALAAELGDCLWQLSACAGELGLDLSDIAEMNLDKLSSRDARGVIVGEGDNR